jgi:CDP-paratose 2-epimerase
VAPADPALRAAASTSPQPLDFRTPYGCSKGVADQYVLDYARSYGLPAAVLRMSCIYGPRQFGTEDQGWVAHFLIRRSRAAGIDLRRRAAGARHLRRLRRGARLPAGAGPDRRPLRQGLQSRRRPANAVSLRDVLDEIGRLTGRPVPVSFHDWRPGDQPWFVADTRALEQATGWRPRTPWREGLADLAAWLAGTRIDLPHEPQRLRA